MNEFTLGSIFVGIGGIDLGLERAGMICRWQVEKDKFARAALERHWPNVKRYEDTTTLSYGKLERVHALVCGDPCPIRSRARHGFETQHPDLSPYFLEAVRVLRPIWVLRENVPHPDVHQFALCLGWLGYDSCILKVDSADITDQSRPREIVVGLSAATGHCPIEVFSQHKSNHRHRPTLAKNGRPLAACLTARFKQFSVYDNFVAEPGRGIRVLTGVERARLQGFPDDWLSGFSETQQARLFGNAVTVPIFTRIGHMILQAERKWWLEDMQ